VISSVPAAAGVKAQAAVPPAGRAGGGRDGFPAVDGCVRGRPERGEQPRPVIAGAGEHPGDLERVEARGQKVRQRGRVPEPGTDLFGVPQAVHRPDAAAAR